ncbi:hypothetical protein ESCNG_220016 [Neisseria gonorrhoeae]|uniref:Uncharacterized protein n=1 Tax=Neisseria gonorrhoeae TaxID=485 RepID=A0AB74EPN3_NEIGO|nr:hypothetical protein ESCNG_220016 [Neisseria gonorrhoeae]SCW13253.1 hypothetical protein ESCNG_20302 [Neisseria gonorrhoeae]
MSAVEVEGDAENVLAVFGNDGQCVQELVEGLCAVEFGKAGKVAAVERGKRREYGSGLSVAACGQDVAIEGVAAELELDGVMGGVPVGGGAGLRRAGRDLPLQGLF